MAFEDGKCSRDDITMPCRAHLCVSVADIAPDHNSVSGRWLIMTIFVQILAGSKRFCTFVVDSISVLVHQIAGIYP